MKILRALLVFALAALAGPVPAQQPYPSRPIRIIVAFTAGAQADLIARRLGPKMSEHWGQRLTE